MIQLLARGSLIENEILEAVNNFNAKFLWRHLFYLSYEPFTKEISVLTFTSEVPVSYEYVKVRGVGHIVCRVKDINLLCSSNGYLIVEKDVEEGLVEYVAPLLLVSGFKKDSLIMYYVSKPKSLSKAKEIKHILLDSRTLEPLDLTSVLPEETIISDNGGGAIGYYDYELIHSLRGGRYVYQELIPRVVKQILTKLYGEEPKEWRGRVVPPLSKPTLTVNIGGEEYLVLHLLVERPIREHILERGLSELVKVLKKLRVPRGVLLMLYIEKILVSGFRVYTPRLFWYLLSYDRERGLLTAPGTT